MSSCGSPSGARFDRRRNGSCATLAPVKGAALLVVALALCAGPSLLAQRVQRRVYVTATDGSGTPIINLGVGEFELVENGTPREIVRATRFGGPLRIALVVDSSSAVAPLLNSLRAGLTTFLDELPGEHEITFITTGGQIRIRQPVTTDRKKLLDAAHRIFARPGGGAYLMDAIVDVSRGFKKREAKRPVIVVLMMENDVEFSNRHYDNVLKELQTGGGTLHVVALGVPPGSMSDEIRNRDQVVALGTERTGGRRDNVIALTAAAPRMKQLAAELTHQYVVTYTRPETLIPPEKIEVTVSKPGLTARARTRTGQVGAK